MKRWMFAAVAVAGAAVRPYAQAATAKIDSGDTAWMIVATAMVMLMTLPGLALFYGGIATEKRHTQCNGNVVCYVLHCELFVDRVRISAGIR